MRKLFDSKSVLKFSTLNPDPDEEKQLRSFGNNDTDFPWLGVLATIGGCLCVLGFIYLVIQTIRSKDKVGTSEGALPTLLAWL